MEQLSRLFLSLTAIEAENSDDLASVVSQQQQLPEGEVQLRDHLDPIALCDTVPDHITSVISAIDIITPLISSQRLVPSSISNDKVG